MKALVIGSGIAGIAASIRLAIKGYDVQVLEKNAYTGGKLSELVLGDYRFDAGPSLFTMPQYVDELFTLAGEKANDFFSYQRVSASCEYFFPDGTTMTAWADRNKLLEEFHQKTGVSKEALLKHLKRSEKLFDLTHRLFMESALNKRSTYLNKDAFRALLNLGSLRLLSSMNHLNEKALQNDKMQQYFNRFATYNGSNPYKCPAVLNVIPHLEHGIGTFFPKGGMIAIRDSLQALAERLGVLFHLNCEVKHIALKANKVIGVQTQDDFFEAELVVANADVYPVYDKLLKKPIPRRIKKAERSSSAIIFYWGVSREFKELGLHNIFFSGDYQKEFDFLFSKSDMYEDPTVYVNISSKLETRDAPKSSENWFVMVNAPANANQDWDELIFKTRARVLDKLQRMLGCEIESHIEVEDYLDPRRIESKTSSYMGSLYGTSSNDRMSAFLRHSNKSSNYKGLYFCGGSVHPGGGIPLCLLSAKITVDEIPPTT